MSVFLPHHTSDPLTNGDLPIPLLVFTISQRVSFPLAAVIDSDRRDKFWFEPYAIDTAYLHVTVFAVEVFVDKALNRGSLSAQQEAGFHFLKGVRLLRQRLLLADEEPKISDSTVSAF